MRNKLITKADVQRDYKEPSKLRRLWWKLNDFDWFPYSIKQVYYKILPYDYRPKQLYYKLKCFLFKRYTTIKPRQLGHTWFDKSELLPYVMFECLSQFVEGEMVDSIVDWYHEDCHKIKVNGVEVKVADELLALYNWWHLKYLKAYPAIEEELWNKVHALEETHEFIPEEFEDQQVYRWEVKYKSPEDEIKSRQLHDIIWNIEREIENELTEKLIRLIKVRNSMWT